MKNTHGLVIIRSPDDRLDMEQDQIILFKSESEAYAWAAARLVKAGILKVTIHGLYAPRSALDDDMAYSAKEAVQLYHEGIPLAECFRVLPIGDVV